MKPGDTFTPYQKFLTLHIPISLASDSGLSWAATALYGLLSYHAGNKDSCFVRLDTLARELGTNVDTIGRAAKELTQAGLIESKRRGLGRENLYTFTWQPVLEGSLKVSESAKVRNQDSAEMRNQESAKVRSLNPQKCGGDSAEMRNPLKEEEITEEIPLRETSSPSDDGGLFPEAPRAESLKEKQARWTVQFLADGWSKKGKAAVGRELKKHATSDTAWEKIHAAELRQKPAMMQREPQFRPRMDKWLKDGCYDDEEDTPSTLPAKYEGGTPRGFVDRFALNDQRRDETFDRLMRKKLTNGTVQ